MKTRTEKVLAVILTCAMLLQLLPISLAFASGMGHIEEKVSASFSSILEAKQEKVTVSVVGQADNVTVVGITLPNGTFAKGHQGEYVATENGSYQFEVFYEETIPSEVIFPVENETTSTATSFSAIEAVVPEPIETSQDTVIEGSTIFTYEVTSLLESVDETPVEVHCICEAKCTVGENETESTINANCPVCGVVTSDLTLCVGKAVTPTLQTRHTPAEQYTLPVGNTYYFDLSDEIGNIGTVNAGFPGNDTNPNKFDSIPDTSLHYVPFTYAGTIEAYNLSSSDSGDFTASDTASMNPSSRSLFVSEYNVSHTINWNDLNTSDLIFGKVFDTHYTLRSLTGGSNRDEATKLEGIPVNNEWDQLVEKNTDFIKNWWKQYSWGQDTYLKSHLRVARGYTASSGIRSNTNTLVYPYFYGFRPALEVLNTSALNADGLKVVTLDLNGGSFVNERDEEGTPTNTVNSISIVCAGDSFTATSDVGLTPPTDMEFVSWNTMADGSGDSYDVGDSVPNTVTSLYAQWAPPNIEQFNLPLNGTYYFDLSSEIGNIGTVNVGNTEDQPFPSVPDTSLHYVPFTYTGTLNAYSLGNSSSGDESASESATPSERSLFVSEYNVSHTISWNELVGLNQDGTGSISEENLVFGKTFDTHYKLRSLSGGNNWKEDSGMFAYLGGTPTTNEWDQLLAKSTLTDPIKNWEGLFTWMQDTTSFSYSSETSRTNRGGVSADNWFLEMSTIYGNYLGWRPALEVLNPGTLGANGLKPVNLDLNGGSFVSQRDNNGNATDTVTDLNIVCAGDSFTATSDVGLTRPAGNTDSYFKWNTVADGSGDSYDVGDNIPNTVTTLYAQWTPTTYAITVNNGSSDKPTAEEGSTVRVTAGPPASGQVFDQWTSADGVVFADKTATSTTFTMPPKAVTVTATYKNSDSSGGGSGDDGSSYNYYSITATANSNGNISPNGKISLREGRDKTFTITPDEGFEINDVLVDGKSIGIVTSYTFGNVKRSHTIEVFFTKSNPNTGLVPDLNKEDHFAYLNGYPDNTFSPSKPMTRAEVAVMFSRLLTVRMDSNKEYTASFTDVYSTMWYGNTIGYMEQFGILKGYPDGTFKPDAPITRAEFATIIGRFDNITEGEKTGFIDLSDTHWAKSSIEKAYSRGWISGYPDSTVRPDHFITRAEVTAIVNRILEREPDQAYIDANTSLLKLFNDVPKHHWAYYTIIEASNGHDYINTNAQESWTEIKGY